MALTDILGFTAAFMTTTSFLPQAIKVLKTRDTRSLSLTMYSMFTIGVAFWLAYGLQRNDWAVIVANIVTLILASAILTIKVINESNARRR